LIALEKKNIDFKKYISYILIAYAFSFPVSKAATNFFEILAILLWIAEGGWKKKFEVYKTNLLSIAIASLIGFSLLSILWHGDAETTLRYVAKYRHLLIIFVFYTSFDMKYTRTILSTFLISIFLSELMSYAIFFELIQYKNISPSDPSPFMSHMTYSTVLAFTTAVLLIMLAYEEKLKYKLFYIFFFISATTNLFVNGGRTGQIIYIILIITVAFSLIRHKLIALLGALTTLAIVFSLAYNFSPNFHNRANLLYTDFNNMIGHNDYSGSGATKVALTTIGLKTIKNNFFFGTGIAYSMDNIKKYSTQLGFDPQYMDNFADYHSTFLTISAQLGIVGILISLAIMYALISFHSEKREYTIIGIAFAITFIIFSFTHNTLHTMNPMVFFALFGGFFNALSKQLIPSEDINVK